METPPRPNYDYWHPNMFLGIPTMILIPIPPESPIQDSHTRFQNSSTARSAKRLYSDFKKETDKTGLVLKLKVPKKIKKEPLKCD